MSEDGLNYRSAGVNLTEARRSLDSITESIRSTYTPAVVGDVGSFGGMISGVFPALEDPVLVSSIDGVGTKTAVASKAGMYRGLGRDIVCHCVDDILVQGAKPLFFMDYFGTAKLSADILADIVDGAAEACRENGCALLGGETAEMPGVYTEGEFDVVGAITGVVDRQKILPSPNVGHGDLIVGLASDGLHTNGFALARAALFDRGGRRYDEQLPDLGRSLAEELLRPHRPYLSSIYPLLEEGGLVRAIAHITGGGLYENLPRALGSSFGAVIERRSWTPNPIFGIIQEAGGIEDEEMFHVFNMGIGMALICPSEAAGAVVQRLNDANETAFIIGEVTRGPNEVALV
ncbi:MAG: phosphoribosylformylglycinamidine cyclo-ligase [Armatimonadetes bacterium]|nr:phosphoribosylformylglycinamidine cyclo-ligase [Armatimonadota bacterium]